MKSLLLILFSLLSIGRSEATSGTRTAFVHLFEWRWTDIARECTEFLGPNGFAAVQVSPPNEHVTLDGNPWYQRYQPVSYKLESRSGTRAEFVNMVRACKEAGVDIYADAVINHMTGTSDEWTKTGFAGSAYRHYDYSGLYSHADFHHCGRNGDDDIRNYSDRFEVQNCELVNLADLVTASDYVKTQISNYLNDLIEIGVRGFRIDAAKHIPSEDLSAILARLHKDPYVFQEVIDQGGEPIQATEYLANGDVTEFRYGLDLARILRTGKLAWLNGEHLFGREWGYISGDHAIVFVDNHDNQRGHGGGGRVLTHKEPELYTLANVLMLAWPFGYPSIMSSYIFSDPSQGPPANGAGVTRSVFSQGYSSCLRPEEVFTAKEGWVCEHRWPAIANMVRFRNATAAHFYLTNWWSNGENQIAFGRGPSGFVVINIQDQPLQREFKTSMPAGTYCDVVANRSTSRTSCSVPIRVSADGNAVIAVPPRTAVAIHI